MTRYSIGLDHAIRLEVGARWSLDDPECVEVIEDARVWADAIGHESVAILSHEGEELARVAASSIEA